VSANYDFLFGKMSDGIPLSSKSNIWLGILEQINSQGVEYRTVSDIKKKWYDCRRRLRNKLAKMESARRTGGGLCAWQRLSWVEQRIRKTFHPHQIQGTNGIAEESTAPPPAPPTPPPHPVTRPVPVASSPTPPPAEVPLTRVKAPQPGPDEIWSVDDKIFRDFVVQNLEFMEQYLQYQKKMVQTIEVMGQKICDAIHKIADTLGHICQPGNVAQGESKNRSPFSPPRVSPALDPGAQPRPAPDSTKESLHPGDCYILELSKKPTPIINPPNEGNPSSIVPDSGCRSVGSTLDLSSWAPGPPTAATFLPAVKKEQSSSTFTAPVASGNSSVTQRHAKSRKWPVRRSSRLSKT
ncbi:hypothetical protein GDO81_025057, partial [Engystomops pustulosus]